MPPHSLGSLSHLQQKPIRLSVIVFPRVIGFKENIQELAEEKYHAQEHAQTNDTY
jgi:hypothetical protein